MTVRTQVAGYLGQVWSAAAAFVANAGCTMDLGCDAPLSGASYEGVDLSGLFWSMWSEMVSGQPLTMVRRSRSDVPFALTPHLLRWLEDREKKQ